MEEGLQCCISDRRSSISFKEHEFEQSSGLAPQRYARPSRGLYRSQKPQCKWPGNWWIDPVHRALLGKITIENSASISVKNLIVDFAGGSIQKMFRRCRGQPMHCIRLEELLSNLHGLSPDQKHYLAIEPSLSRTSWGGFNLQLTDCLYWLLGHHSWLARREHVT